MSKAKQKKEKPKKKDILEAIVLIACLPILAISLFASIMTYQTKQQGKVPTLFGYSFLTVVSNSMEPELAVGESFFCKRISFEDVQVGDIISFYRGSSVITHKVFSKNTMDVDGKEVTYLETYGVNNINSAGECVIDQNIVVENNFIGVYQGKTFFSKFASFLSGGWGMLCFIILPLGFVIISDLLSLVSLIQVKIKAGYAEEVEKFNARFDSKPIEVDYSVSKTGTYEGKKVLVLEVAHNGVDIGAKPRNEEDFEKYSRTEKNHTDFFIGKKPDRNERRNKKH